MVFLFFILEYKYIYVYTMFDIILCGNIGVGKST
jgi:hypothetical protein